MPGKALANAAKSRSHWTAIPAMKTYQADAVKFICISQNLSNRRARFAH
jgi:hypothetical protein